MKGYWIYQYNPSTNTLIMYEQQLTLRRKLDNQFQEQDSRRLWQGLQAITSYKGGMTFDDNSDPNLPDNLNDFYARFDKANTDVFKLITISRLLSLNLR